MILQQRPLLVRFFLIPAISSLVVLAAAPLCGLAAQAGQPSHLAQPTALRCNTQSEPLAVDAGHPAFSWSVAAASTSLHAVSQSAYQLRVTAAGKPLWDGGKVPGAATSGILYAGPSLVPGQLYTWQVRLWDEANHPTSWSGSAHWTQAPVFHAQWIAAQSADSPSDPSGLPIFRKAFTLKSPVRRAILYASGLGQDELRLNGSKVGDDELTPGWSNYRKTIYYDAYDVTALLHPGPNALGVLLGNGMYRVLKTSGRYTKFEGSMGQPKCLVQLSLELADGTRTEVLSDATWKTAPGPITFSSTYGGEDHDARLAPDHWDQPAFDDSHWQPARITTSPGGTLRPEAAPPIRVLHTYAPIKRTQPKPGILVFDLGQNFAGWPTISASGPAGATVKLIPSELLEKDGTVSQRPSGRPQWYTYTLKGAGVELWHPRFSYYGFRYVQVELTGKAHLVSLTGQAVHTTSEPIGRFASSDPLLNRIHTLILRSIENNAVSLFTDCPHREKLGWLEETHLMAPSMLYDFDLSGLFAATARNIADAQYADGPYAGMVPDIAPEYVVFQPGKDGPFDDSPEWGSAAILAPWYAYQRSGDVQLLAAQLPVMRAYEAYLGSRANQGIIAYGLGDWYDIGPGNPGFGKLTTLGLTATATWYQDLRVLERVTALLGKLDESRLYHDKAEATRANFNARFFHADTPIYDRGSQTAQAMPLVVGLVPETDRAAVLDALVADIRAHQNHVTAGDVGYHYVVDALLENGRSDVLLDMLQRTDTPSYGYQLAQGATSLTEAWDANPTSSQDHFMLGDAEEWFYRGLGGVTVDLSAPAPAQILIAPSVPGQLASVSTSYRSALGPIQSNWHRGPASTTYRVAIPANTTATLRLQTAAPDLVRVNGRPAAKAPGVLATTPIAGGLQLTVASGSYDVVAANPARQAP